MTSIPPKIFDRRRLAIQRASKADAAGEFDFLYAECAARLCDRVLDINRSFERTLIIGDMFGCVKKILISDMGYDASQLVTLDLFETDRVNVIGDEEYIPFQKDSFDLVLAQGALPFVNDIPGVLAQIGYILKPDGLFMGNMLGTLTLYELRDSLMKAEDELLGGISNRVAPFVDIVDATALMQRAKFALPVVDQEIISVGYKDIFSLLRDIKGMGLSHPMYRGASPFSRDLFKRAGEIYTANHAGDGGRLTASFEVLTLTGWTPHESQQQPLRPGSAETRLADALDSDEVAVDDIATP